MKGFALVCVTGLVVGLSGCSSEEPTEQAAPTTAAVATPTATPAPTTLTLEEAAAEYRRIVAPSNAALEESDNLLEAGKTREGCEYRIPSNQEFAAALRNTPWPAEAVRTAERLADDIDKYVQASQACASATSEDEAVIAFEEVYTEFDSREGTQLANAMRTILGLPPVS